MEVITICGQSEEEVSSELQEAVEESSDSTTTGENSETASTTSENGGTAGKTNKQMALVIEGTSLTHAMTKENEEKLLKLAGMCWRCRTVPNGETYEIIELCSSVLCVRATPLQKAELVRLVRTNLNVVTLAIGDDAVKAHVLFQYKNLLIPLEEQ